MREPPINICPLLAIAGAGGTSGPAVCLQERCAWAYEGGCALVSIARSLDSLDTSGIITYEG